MPVTCTGIILPPVEMPRSPIQEWIADVDGEYTRIDPDMPGDAFDVSPAASPNGIYVVTLLLRIAVPLGLIAFATYVLGWKTPPARTSSWTSTLLAAGMRLSKTIS